MKKSILIAAATLTIGLLSTNVFAQVQQPDTSKKTPATTNSATSAPAAATTDTTSKKDIVATLANVASETTFSAAIKAANIEADLKAVGPFTVLAPSNDDFAALPKGKVDSLLKDPAKAAVVLKAHVISGLYDKAAFIKALTAGKGTATLKTIDGQTLTLSVKDKKLAITDSQGNVVEVTSFDTLCTNGVIHGINGVLMSK